LEPVGGYEQEIRLGEHSIKGKKSSAWSRVAEERSDGGI
jgi:hypothetical protein